jgi:hypothetical protein
VAGAQRAAKIAFEVVIVQRASAAAGNVLALLQVESVTLMSAATAGLGKYQANIFKGYHTIKVLDYSW